MHNQQNRESIKFMGSPLPAPIPAVVEMGPFFSPFPKNEIAVESRSSESLLRSLLTVLDKTLLSAVESRTQSEFENLRRDLLPRYARALRAYSDTMQNILEANELARVSAEATADLTSEFEQRGESQFGGKLTDQALFTLWTLGEIRILALRIGAAPLLTDEACEPDKSLLFDYYNAALWAQFHLDCLVASLKFGRCISENVRDGICEGMRSAANAYSAIKAAHDLRFPMSDEAAEAPRLWDEEDEELLAGSTGEADAELSDDY